MNYLHKELSFPSSDGKNNIHAEIFIPSDNKIRGVVQISHGMRDYIGRYALLVEAFTAAGFVVAGNDHLGHGGSVKTQDDFGLFASGGGYNYVIDDVYKMNRILKLQYPDKPIVLLGHSMGSFICRLYASHYAETINGLIIHGTAGPNPAVGAGKLVVKILKVFNGERYRSKFVCMLAEGGYSKSFDPKEGPDSWLTRELSLVASRPTDPKTNFTFTLSGYGDLFSMLGECNAKSWFETFPNNLPTLVVSGDRDPVGDFGKGVKYVYENLKKNGADVSLKLYPDARHELFNETNRREVFNDLIAWIGKIK